jgi:hypothetical protein
LRRPATLVVIGVLALVLGLTAVVGADFLWLVALGEDIIGHGRIPDGVPFAAAPSGGWPNVLVLAELGLALLWRAGPTSALVLAVLVAIGTAALLARAGARRGAGDGAVAFVLVLVVAGSITAWGVVRLQTLSLVPFATLCLLLQAECDRPSRRIWLVPPLLAIWGNLHGAVLVGVCLAGAYLLVARLRRDPVTAVAVGIACLAALFANPAGLRTLDYYRGVLGNEAAAAESQLWAAIDLSRGADRVLVVSVVVLLVAASRRLHGWEVLAVAGLAVGTGTAARHGIWLLFVLAAPAAVGLAQGLARAREGRAGGRTAGRWAMGGEEIGREGAGREGAGREGAGREGAGREGAGRGSVVRLAWPALAVVCVISGVAAAVARPQPVAQVDLVSAAAITAAAGSRVVLAPEPLVEALAVGGARVWVSDPLDAFRPADQRAYLSFLDGSPGWTDAARPVVEIVIAARGSQGQAHLVQQGLVPVTDVALPGEWVMYRWP